MSSQAREAVPWWLGFVTWQTPSGGLCLVPALPPPRAGAPALDKLYSLSQEQCLPVTVQASPTMFTTRYTSCQLNV